MKISVIGAGSVGATCAEEIVRQQLASDVVLLDIKEGVAEGKALDMYQASANTSNAVRIQGVTNDFTATRESQLIIISSGVPRKPGMTREELIDINANILQSVMDNCLKYAPEAIFIIVSNPVDTLSYIAIKKTGLPRHRIIGLGGVLDSSRFKAYLSLALQCSISDLQAMVIGGHGDTTMVPLIDNAYLQCQPVRNLLDEASRAKIVADTMKGGATLTQLLGTSAWYGPGAAVGNMVKSIVRDEKRILPCSIYLEGEYGEKDIFIGVPIVLGKKGMERIVTLQLSEKEKELFAASAKSVRAINQLAFK